MNVTCMYMHIEIVFTQLCKRIVLEKICKECNSLIHDNFILFTVYTKFKESSLIKEAGKVFDFLRASTNNSLFCVPFSFFFPLNNQAISINKIYISFCDFTAEKIIMVKEYIIYIHIYRSIVN